MEYADNDGVRVTYERAGTRDGETVVLAEGLPEAALETFEEGGSHLFFTERADDVKARLHSLLP